MGLILTPDKEDLKKFSKRLLIYHQLDLKKRNIENSGKTEDYFLNLLLK